MTHEKCQMINDKLWLTVCFDYDFDYDYDHDYDDDYEHGE